MITRLVAAHELAVCEDGTLIDSDTTETPFSAEAYSRMKFGDADATQQLAQELTAVLVDQVPELVDGQEGPLFAVAFKAVPPACFYLSRNCLAGINEVRVNNELEPGRVVHVYKDRVTATNYASSSHADRQAELANIGFSFEGRDISSSPVVVLDDVRITGSAERCMADLIERGDAPQLVVGYVALLDPEAAILRPSIENEMNTVVVKDIHDVAEIISTGRFELNIRTLKLILGSEPSDLYAVLDELDPHTTELIYEGAIATGPEFIAQYKAGMNILSRYIQTQRSAAR